jgi:hypothetical protein
MARAYSLDLRKRVVAAIAGGRTCRTAAMITSDSDASLKWCSIPPLWHIDVVRGGRGDGGLGLGFGTAMRLQIPRYR